MVRLVIFTALVALVVLSTATAQDLYRVLNRKEGSWLNGHTGPDDAPIVVEEKSAGDLGIWRIVNDGGRSHTFYNKGSGLPVVSLDSEDPLMTTGAHIPPSRVRFEAVDTSAYRINDIETNLYWTRIDNEVYLRPRGASDDNQIWELQPAGFDEEFAFWE
ncbi:hypothetical protein DFQ27_005989 [Actinomortierella ambigua]|uniref:Ricin B lectin domain-containing protein n=1 Tax=Actinomortierella ambigua TaxID=1343610 RepID=A0A9P6Q0G3_9FUNG|nr:hypothetical protein DFQ27_005989 [Actinomortierella ambigua]